MKKQTTLFTLALLACGLFACKPQTLASSAPASSVAPSSTVSSSAPVSSASVAQSVLSITVSGTSKEVGDTLTFVASVDKSPITDQENVVYAGKSDADKAMLTIVKNKATLLKSGDVTVTASYAYEGNTLTAEFTFTIAEGVPATSIADVKKNATTTAKAVKIQGVVTAHYGKGGFVDDGTDAIYVYSWYSSSTDTAITKQSYGYGLTLGDSVELYAYVYTYSGLAEISASYQNADKTYTNLSGAYFKKIDKKFTPTEASPLDEAGLKALTDAQSGHRYTFQAKYVSGAPTDSASNTSVLFTLGSTQFALFTSKKELDQTDLLAKWTALNLTAGDEVSITAPFYQLYGTSTIDFAYYSFGTEIVKKGLTLGVTANHYVGQTMTLTAALDGVVMADQTKVNYAVTAGTATSVTLSGNQVTVNAADTLTITGTYSADATTTYTATVSFTTVDITAVSTIANAKNAKDGDLVHVQGVVEAGEGKNAVIADSTSAILAFNGKSTAEETDTAISSGIWTNQATIDFVGKISTYQGYKELTLAKMDASMPSSYAKLLTGVTVTPITLPIEIKTSDAYLDAFSTVDVAKAGLIYKISSATYTGSSTSGSTYLANFKLGTLVTFSVKFNAQADLTALSLVEQTAYTVTATFAPYSGKVQFTYFTTGNTIVAA